MKRGFGFSLKGLGTGSGFGPALRRFFVNTLFDSTFMSLGIVVGSGLSEHPDIEVIIATMLTTSLALGISTGVSVYEAEGLERGRRIAEIERAMLRDLDNSAIYRTARAATLIIALVNFSTPLMTCAVTIVPFLLVLSGTLTIQTASYAAVSIALGILFTAGVVLGRWGGKNPLIKGVRMLGFGVLAFIIGYFIDALL
ncbi:MAG: hypothetical protein KJ653_06910 [Candidatus Thermoplasmatota archaeon]|nr:hypothetical protein [Candidatus Thermoplasmatota archaeon]